MYTYVYMCIYMYIHIHIHKPSGNMDSEMLKKMTNKSGKRTEAQFWHWHKLDHTIDCFKINSIFIEAYS